MTDFKQLVDDFMANEFSNSPVTASYLGLTDYDGQLDDLSAEAFLRRDAEAAEWLARFEAVDEAGLDLDEGIDRELAISTLRGRLIHADWQVWKRDPVTYSGPILNGLFYLFLNRLRPTADLVDAAVARLEQVPAALGPRPSEPRSDARPQADRRARRGFGARRGGLRARDARRRGRDGLTRASACAQSGATAGEAFDEYVAHLEHLAQQATGEWRYGEERYSRQLREREVIDLDARSLRDMGQAEYDRLDAEMSALAMKRTRHGRLEGRPRRGERGPPADRGGDAPGVRRLDRSARGRSSPRRAW